MKYFDFFPSILYDINTDSKVYDQVTNIFIRMGILSVVKNNAFAYYDYLVREQDTPENLAERYYGDPEYHWIVLYMNSILDPLFDWPLKIDDFNNMIVSKYGSIETAKTNIHHYEKVITRGIVNSETTSVITLVIDEDTYDLLPDTSYEVETLASGLSIMVTIERKAVTMYDYENSLNENHRNIKLIMKEHAPQLVAEFKAILDQAGARTSIARTVS